MGIMIQRLYKIFIANLYNIIYGKAFHANISSEKVNENALVRRCSCRVFQQFTDALTDSAMGFVFIALRELYGYGTSCCVKFRNFREYFSSATDFERKLCEISRFGVFNAETVLGEVLM